jgi:hypothetical protein
MSYDPGQCPGRFLTRASVPGNRDVRQQAGEAQDESELYGQSGQGKDGTGERQ